MDFLDVLNEKGDYINRVEARDICHKEGLWHKAVALFIINSKDQVLLQKRSPQKKLWPNLWDITAGGHVLAGEFGFQSLIRETREELGITIDIKDVLFLGSTISSNIKGDILNNHFNEYYICHSDVNISNLKLQPEEVSDIKWVDKDEILDRISNNYDGITGDKYEVWNYLKKYYEWKNINKI